MIPRPAESYLVNGDEDVAFVYLLGKVPHVEQILKGSTLRQELSSIID